MNFLPTISNSYRARASPTNLSLPLTYSYAYAEGQEQHKPSTVSGHAISSEWAHNAFVRQSTAEERPLKTRPAANTRKPLQPRQAGSAIANQERNSVPRGGRDKSTITLQKLIALSQENGRASLPSDSSSSGPSMRAFGSQAGGGSSIFF